MDRSLHGQSEKIQVDVEEFRVGDFRKLTGEPGVYHSKKRLLKTTLMMFVDDAEDGQKKIKLTINAGLGDTTIFTNHYTMITNYIADWTKLTFIGDEREDVRPDFISLDLGKYPIDRNNNIITEKELESSNEDFLDVIKDEEKKEKEKFIKALFLGPVFKEILLKEVHERNQRVVSDILWDAFEEKMKEKEDFPDEDWEKVAYNVVADLDV